LKKLISHTKTEAGLSSFQEEERDGEGGSYMEAGHCGVGDSAKQHTTDMVHLQSDNEEADTKIILHALDAIADGATELSIYSPDTMF